MSFDVSRSLKILTLLGAAGAALSACASKPKPPEPAAVASTPYPSPPPPPPGRNEAPTPRTIDSRPTGPVPGSAQDFAISAGDRVFFDYDQYAVRTDSRAVLDRQAAWLQRYARVQVRIEGNADERGTREYNFALGARRAEAVKAYLEAHGVGAGRISTISYGKERPLDDSGTEDGMARNRNGHTTITSGGGQ